MLSTKLFYSVGWFYEIAKGIIISVAILIVIFAILGTVFVVDGVSMEPNFHDKQYILVEKLSYLLNEPARGDNIVLRFPGDPDNKKYIKRIIGLPGETIEINDGKVYINGKVLSEFYIDKSVKTMPNMKMIILSDEYFVIGDNRPNSSDSRIWGTCPRKNIIGKTYVIFYPFKDFSVIPPVEY
jgi:signal peptidase I